MVVAGYPCPIGTFIAQQGIAQFLFFTRTTVDGERQTEQAVIGLHLALVDIDGDRGRGGRIF